MTLRTEFQFTLPRGYADRDGNLHKEGVIDAQFIGNFTNKGKGIITVE